jgi:hypothetical protein
MNLTYSIRHNKAPLWENILSFSKRPVGFESVFQGFHYSTNTLILSVLFDVRRNDWNICSYFGTFEFSASSSFLPNTGVYISVQKQYLFPENDIFFPSRDTLFFDSHRGLFALFLLYFAIILPFYFPFSHFLSPFFIFIFLPLSSFFFPPSSFFFYIFPLLLFVFIFSPPNDIG